MSSPLLTKSGFLNSLQCSKYIWTVINQPDKIPGKSEAGQAVFRSGYQFENAVKGLFPGGIDLGSDDFSLNIRNTREALKERRTVFEAGIRAGDLYSRIDILKPSGKDEWDILEIKSSASVKKVHIDDIAFQKYCCINAGLKTGRCFILYVNSRYVRRGNIDLSMFVIKEDVTEKADKRLKNISDDIKSAFDAAGQSSCPEPGIGEYCSSPYNCPLKYDCWSFLPEKNSVFTLYRGKKASWELFRKNILNLADIPDDFVLSEYQSIQKECALDGKPHTDKKAVRDFLSQLEYPLHFLDFETFSSPVPLFNNTKSYQNIPFQYSLHIVDGPGKKPDHFSFLYDRDDYPGMQFIKSLLDKIKPQGSVIVYNENFEKRILNSLALEFPEYKKQIDEIILRIRDLIIPFKKFHYYSPLQQGSASLKKVLPALTGKDYSALDIADGGTASAFFSMVYHDKKYSGKEAEKIRSDLEKYCGLDTEAMIWILGKLIQAAV